MKKYIVGSIIIGIALISSFILGGIHYLKTMELPPVLPFIFLTSLVVLFIILAIIFALNKISKYNSKKESFNRKTN